MGISYEAVKKQKIIAVSKVKDAKGEMSKSLYIDIIIDNICNDIQKARDNGILAGAIILTLSAIDAMAYLSMPTNKKDVDKTEYIRWVEKYMKTNSIQSYQYRGIDLYGARCGIIHRYGVESNLSENGLCKIFGYHNGSGHIYNSTIKKDMVMMSIWRFTQDFFRAVEKFLEDIIRDKELKLKTDSRIKSLFRIAKRNN